MKPIITTLLFALISVMSFAQKELTSSKAKTSDSTNKIIKMMKEKGLTHMTFKDIPMDGPLSAFVAKLQKQGFEILRTKSDNALLSGKFTGENVGISIQAFNNVVYSVTVLYDRQHSWKAIKGQYEDMKRLLIRKYGEPRKEDVVEQFDDPDTEKLGLEMFALSNNKFTYSTGFTTPEMNGIIKLSISSTACIVINYTDVLNFVMVNGAALDDL